VVFVIEKKRVARVITARMMIGSEKEKIPAMKKK